MSSRRGFLARPTWDYYDDNSIGHDFEFVDRANREYQIAKNYESNSFDYNKRLDIRHIKDSLSMSEMRILEASVFDEADVKRILSNEYAEITEAIGMAAKYQI